MSIPKRNKTHWKFFFGVLLVVFVILLAKVGFDAKLFSGNLGGPTVAQSPNVANIKYNPCKQTRVLNTLVFMDDNSYSVQDPEILDTFNYASNLLMERTCTKFNVLKIWHVNPTKGEDIDKITYSTLKANNKLLDQSQYFVFFTDQNIISHQNGGVEWPVIPAIPQIGDQNFCNTFSGPTDKPTGYLYGALVDWNHRFGVCGYDDNDNLISDVSYGGQCQNQSGLKCVWSPTANYYTCPQFVDNPKVLEPRLFRSFIIIHELMHSFGTNVDGNTDHTVGSKACIDKYNSMNYKLNFQCPANGDLSECWFNICQYAWVNFIQAKNICNLPKVFKPNANQIPAINNSSLNLKAHEEPFN